MEKSWEKGKLFLINFNYICSLKNSIKCVWERTEPRKLITPSPSSRDWILFYFLYLRLHRHPFYTTILINSTSRLQCNYFSFIQFSSYHHHFAAFFFDFHFFNYSFTLVFNWIATEILVQHCRYQKRAVFLFFFYYSLNFYTLNAYKRTFQEHFNNFFK